MIKRILLTLLLLVSLATPLWAVDVKLSALPEATAVTGDDLLLITDDPLGTPVSKRITAANFFGTFWTGGTAGQVVKMGSSATGFSTFTIADTFAKGTFLYNATANTVDAFTHPGAANYLIATNSADTAAWFASSAAVITILGSADAATFRSNAGLAIGTNVQAASAILLGIAATTPAAGLLGYTGAAYDWYTGISLSNNSLRHFYDETAGYYSNSDCTANLVPAACCTGVGTGTCAPKYVGIDPVNVTGTKQYTIQPIATADTTFKPGQTFTNTKWCSFATATGLTCNENAPAGGTTMANDAMWAAEGDLAIATGNDAGAVLTKGAEGTILRAGAARPAYTTSTFADTYAIGTILHASGANTVTGLAAGATGKVLIAKGAAAPEWTPYTFPATVPTVGKVLISDGTNLIGSTALGTGAYATIADYAAVGQTFYIGTTQVAINRASNALTLAGLTFTTPVIGAATGTSLIVAGRLDGLAGMLITTAASPTTIVVATHGSSSYFMNIGNSAANSIFTLPTAAAGLQYCIRNYTGITAVMKFQTSAGGQYIDLDGVLTASGGLIKSAGAAGDSACVIGVDATHWAAYVQKGTWSKD